MSETDENPDSREDSNQYAKNVVIAVVCAALYLARPAWFPERVAFWVVVTIALFYNVIAHFKKHWARSRFWYAIVILSGCHAAVIGRVDAHLHRLDFWEAMAVIAVEGLAMVLILGWLLRDNYFTRDSR